MLFNFGAAGFARCCVLVFLCSAIIAGYARAEDGAGPTTAPDAIVVEDKNLVVDPPPDPWLRPRYRKIVPGASVEFLRGQPQMSFSVVAVVPPADPELTTVKMAGQWMIAIAGTASSFTLVEKAQQTINGVAGVRLCVELSTNGHDQSVVYWGAAMPGGAYQLITAGEQTDEPLIRAEAQRMNALFHVKDRALFARAGSGGGMHFSSDFYGYSVDIKAPGWRLASDDERSQAGIKSSFCATFGRNALFTVQPIRLVDECPDDETLADGVLRNIGMSLDQVRNKRKIEVNGTKGYYLSFTRARNGKDIHYRAETLQAGHLAYVLAGWTDNPANVWRLDEAMSGFSPAKADAPAIDPLRVPLTDALEQGFILNNFGLICSDRQDFTGAARWHAQSLQLHPDPIVLENLVLDYLSSSRPREALAAVRQWPGLLLLNRPSLKARAAMLEMDLGDADRAMAMYQQLFLDRFENDEALSRYTRLLCKANKADEAMAVVQQYRARVDSLTSTIVEADLLSAKGDFDMAIAIMKDRMSKAGFEPLAAFTLTSYYVQSNKNAEALKTAQLLLDKGQKYANVYLLQGQAQFGLKAYRDAKASFEAAAKADPNNNAAAGWLRQVSGMLGEGENSGIKTPIEAVAIPDSLMHPPLPAAVLRKDASAIQISRYTAISFVRGKELRTTEFRAVKVLNQSGVESMNSFQFPFEPLSEQIYLNRLEVKDADGKVVATGNVNDCYAVDRQQEESASYSKMLHIPVPGLKPGYTVELTLTRREFGTAKQFRFKEMLLSTYYPTVSAGVLLRGDIDAVKVSASNGVTSEPMDGGRCWFVPQPTALRYEPMSEEVERYLPTVWVGDASATWQSEANEYLGTISDVLKPDPQSGALAAELTRGAVTEAQKSAAILKHVQNGYTYKGIEFGRRARIPNRASDVVHNRYGDCKDHALLLHHLLNAAGIPASLALVRSGGPLCAEVPSLDQFDHMIVCSHGPAGGGGERWYDCTDKAGDLSVGIPINLAGKEVLLLDQNSPRLVKIPDYASDSSSFTISRDAKLSGSGDISVHEVIASGGYYASILRGDFQRVEPKNRLGYAQEMLGGRGGAEVILKQIKFNNLEATDQPLLLDMNYEVHGRFSLAGDRLVGALPAPWEHGWLSTDHVVDRESPFCVHFPAVFKTTTTLTLPEGFQCDGAPAARKFSGAFFTGASEVRTSQQDVRQEFTAKATAGHFSAAEYSNYEQAQHEMLNALEAGLVVLHK